MTHHTVAASAHPDHTQSVTEMGGIPMDAYTTLTGRTVTIGQRYQDARRDPPRTLVVTAVDGRPWTDLSGVERCPITLDVVASDGAVLRTVNIEASRLTSSAYRLCQEMA